MANLPVGIANQNVEEALANAGGGSVLIPEGIYKAMFVQGDLKDTTSGGVMLVLKAVITEGPHANVELTERLNIVNSNTTTVKIALESLSRISKAVGLEKTPGNSDVLLRKPLMIKVKTEAGKPWVNNNGETVEGKDKSVIDNAGYKAVLAVVTPSATAVSNAAAPASSMPWMQQ